MRGAADGEAGCRGGQKDERKYHICYEDPFVQHEDVFAVVQQTLFVHD